LSTLVRWASCKNQTTKCGLGIFGRWFMLHALVSYFAIRRNVPTLGLLQLAQGKSNDSLIGE
jgi:hypothetical protein